MSTKFKVWIDSATSSNTMSETDFGNDSQRTNGYEAQQTISAIRMNTILRSTSLISAAIMNALSPNSSLDHRASLANITTEILSHIQVDPSVVNGTGNKSVKTNVSTNDAAHDNSALFGEGLKSSANDQTVLGKYNDDNENALLIVGRGDDDSDRANAFEVLDDGRAKVKSAPTESDDVARKAETDALNNRINALAAPELIYTYQRSAISKRNSPISDVPGTVTLQSGKSYIISVMCEPRDEGTQYDTSYYTYITQNVDMSYKVAVRYTGSIVSMWTNFTIFTISNNVLSFNSCVSTWTNDDKTYYAAGAIKIQVWEM